VIHVSYDRQITNQSTLPANGPNNSRPRCRASGRIYRLDPQMPQETWEGGNEAG
jgi:hypothetical protein